MGVGLQVNDICGTVSSFIVKYLSILQGKMSLPTVMNTFILSLDGINYQDGKSSLIAKLFWGLF